MCVGTLQGMQAWYRAFTYELTRTGGGGVV